MPYIITTTTPTPIIAHYGAQPRERLAVATLDEAREAVITTIIDGPCRYGTDECIKDAYRLREQGGTIRPLPDGTVIEVEWVECAVATLPPIAELEALVETPAHYQL